MSESEYIHKSYNISVLLHHFVCPAKYRRVVFTKAVDEGLKKVCLEISKRYEIRFLEIGVDKDHEAGDLIKQVEAFKELHGHYYKLVC